MTAGDHILEAATCGSQACSMFLLKMAHGEEGEAEKVEWARPILNAQEDAAIEHSSTGVGPDGSVFVDGQFCFGTIEVGDQRNRIPLTLEDNEDCLGFVAKYNASGDLLWARKLSAGSEMMKTGNLKVHPSTGDVFMAGMFMGSEVEFGTFRASSTRNSDTDPADIGRGWYEDTDTSYMHHYSMWIAKVRALSLLIMDSLRVGSRGVSNTKWQHWQQWLQMLAAMTGRPVHGHRVGHQRHGMSDLTLFGFPKPVAWRQWGCGVASNRQHFEHTDGGSFLGTRSC